MTEEIKKLQSELFSADGKLSRAAFNRNKDLIFSLTNFLDENYEKVENQQRLWHIKNDNLSLVYCPICKSSLAKWHNFHKYMCCSKECSKKLMSINNPMKKEEVKKKVESTNIKKYGVKTNFLIIDNPMKNEEIRKKREEECLKKHGVKHYFQSQEVIEKIRSTKKEKGIKSSFKNGLNPALLPDYYEKRMAKSIEKSKKKYEELGYDYIKHIEKNSHLIRCRKCGNEFSHSSNRSYRIENGTDLCPICNPRVYSVSFAESKMYSILCSKFPNETIEQTNRTELINPYTNTPLELDVYFPKYRIAVEFNGVRYHAHPDYYKEDDVIEGRLVKDIWEHDKLKKELCEQRNIKLITVWENEWKSKTFQNILFKRIEKMILDSHSNVINVHNEITNLLFNNSVEYSINGNYISLNNRKIVLEICNFNDHTIEKVGKNYFQKMSQYFTSKGIRYIQIWEDQYKTSKEKYDSFLLDQILEEKTKVFGRKCDVKRIDNSIGYKFQNEYHLQNSTPTTITYGLFHNEELISVMSFKNINKEYNKWEISRLCTKNGITIIGGTEKMLKKFIEENKKENLNSTLITYSDASTFTGRIYEKLGMTEYNMTECGYSYVDENGIRISRQQCKIQKLHKQYPQYQDKTEEEITKLLEYKNIENAGNYKFVMFF